MHNGYRRVRAIRVFTPVMQAINEEELRGPYLTVHETKIIGGSTDFVPMEEMAVEQKTYDIFCVIDETGQEIEVCFKDRLINNWIHTMKREKTKAQWETTASYGKLVRAACVVRGFTWFDRVFHWEKCKKSLLNTLDCTK